MEQIHYQNENIMNDNSSSSFFLFPRTNDGIDDERELTTTTPTTYLYHHKDQFHSYNKGMSTVRDTSDTSRHFELNNTRDNISSSDTSNSRKNINISGVNTHDSILDLESHYGEGDEDTFPICEDDEDDHMITMGDELPSNSLLFDDDDDDVSINELNTSTASVTNRSVRSISPSPPTSPISGEEKDRSVSSNSSSSPDKKKKSSSIMDGLTLYSVTDSFVDSICMSNTCVAPDNQNSYTYNNNTNNTLSSMDNKMNEFQQSCHSALFDRCPVGQSYWQPTEQSSSSSSSSSPSSSRPSDGAGAGEESCTTVVSMDIWELLGCTKPPGKSELEEIWSLRTTSDMLRRGQQRQKQLYRNTDKQGPARASIRRRLKRINRLRMDDRSVSGASRHGVTITNQSYDLDQSYTSLESIRNDIHMNKNNIISSRNACSDHGTNLLHQQVQPSYYCSIDKSYSMMDDPLSNYIGQGIIEPIQVELEMEEEEKGYDSDPEVNYYSASSSMIIIDSSTQSPKQALPAISALTDYEYSEQPHEVLRPYPIPTDEIEMKYLVQQTLNLTWTLTWHTNSENRKKYKISHNKPICINMWLERGTVITNSGVVIEPAFMWRDAYQPLLISQHKLNNSTQKPWSMRLLNACRVTPFISNTTDIYPRPINRTKYPIARHNSSFLLKSCGGEEFLFEVKNPDEAIAVAQRWKLVVARFASLAVTEDVGGIAKEFFHPTSDSKMLTISDDSSI